MKSVSQKLVETPKRLYPNRILSIDWDYITGDCYVQGLTGQAHCGFCDKSYPTGRGGDGLLDIVWEDKENRVLNLNICRDIPIFVAECHASIMDITQYFDGPLTVYDYDSHYDNYDQSYLTCANWIYHLRKGKGNKNVVFSRPREIKDVGAIFICLSSPWTPRSTDSKFFEFIRKISKKTGTSPSFIGHRAQELATDMEVFK